MKKISGVTTYDTQNNSFDDASASVPGSGPFRAGSPRDFTERRRAPRTGKDGRRRSKTPSGDDGFDGQAGRLGQRENGEEVEASRRSTKRTRRQEPAKVGRNRQSARLAEKERLRRGGERRGVSDSSTRRNRLPEEISSADQRSRRPERSPTVRSGDVGRSNSDPRGQETGLRHPVPAQSNDPTHGVVPDRGRRECRRPACGRRTGAAGGIFEKGHRHRLRAA